LKSNFVIFLKEEDVFNSSGHVVFGLHCFYLSWIHIKLFQFSTLNSLVSDNSKSLQSFGVGILIVFDFHLIDFEVKGQRTNFITFDFGVVFVSKRDE